MLWTWWGAMLAAGFVVGCLGAWTTGAARVFMKTLVTPLILIATRLLLPGRFPAANKPLYLVYLLVDLALLAVASFAGDYLLGLKLGRHGRDGFRHDSVGH